MDTDRQADSLRAARESAQLTQEELAKPLGVTRGAISQWEVGATVPSGPSRILLAQVLAVPIEIVDGWFAGEKAA